MLDWLGLRFGAEHFGSAFATGRPADAVAAWERLARSGRRVQRAAAAYKLGVAYDEGRGVTQDYAAAMRWYRRAAEFGDSPARYTLPAMYNIASLYYGGLGVEQDLEQTFAWTERAALGGFPDAQADFGVCFEEGIGVDKDLPRALAWYWFADCGNVGTGETVEEFARRLTRKQRGEAERILKELQSRVPRWTEGELESQMWG